jgi:hypothetical protein
MNRKIYVHIGLPKTATTSLQQDLFPRFEGVKYFGVTHPRSSNYDPGTVYGAFMIGMYTGDTQFFEAALQQCDPAEGVLISEEMITVGTERADWQRNLKNVRRLLGQHDYRLLITVRDPLDAMYSYYVERYDYFRETYKVFDQRIIQSFNMGIYRYQSFLKFLKDEFDFDRIFLADYSNIITGQFFEIERFLNEELPVNIEIRHRNSKAKNAARVYVKNRGSLYGLISEFARARVGSGFLKVCARGIGLIVKPVLQLVSWRRGVPSLSVQQKEKYRSMLVEDANELNKFM